MSIKITWHGTICAIQPRTNVWRYRCDNRTHSHTGYNIFPEGIADGEAKQFSVAISEKQQQAVGLRIGDEVSGTGRTKATLRPGLVNAISPGWIDTQAAWPSSSQSERPGTGSTFEGADATQHPAGRVGVPADIADMVLFLCSDKASFITGENITIDGGMSRLMVYHNDHGWKREGIDQ